MKFIKEQLDIQKQLEDSKLELFELDLVAESQVLAEKNKRLSLEKEFTKTSNKLSELKSNRKEYNSQFFGGINDELVGLEDQRMSLQEDVKKLERQQTDVVVRAPSDGMILDLHSLYPGAVITQGKPVGESILQGEGAGPGPTSSALLSDLISILRGNLGNPFGISSSFRKKIKPFNSGYYTNSLYLRFEVKDKPGVLSMITNRLAKYKISIKRIIQTPDKIKKRATIVIITHKTSEINSKNCLSIFKNNKNILKFPILIRLYN